MNHFTHYWQNSTWEKNQKINSKGALLTHLSGNQFKNRGIEIGDLGYVVTIKKGRLFLCGKLEVGSYCELSEAAKITGLTPDQLWQAKEHLVASYATEMLWDLNVPILLTKQLEFIQGSTINKLLFINENLLDPQTLRGVRLLTLKSAKLLDTLLEELKSVLPLKEKAPSLWNVPASDNQLENNEFESYVEGTQKQKYVTYYERIPENRRQAVKIHGVTCKGCGFNFEKFYGSYGKDFIHIHHINPISELDEPRAINPETDLIPLCPNCHSMVHRLKNKTLSIEELKNIIHTSK